MVLGKGTLNPNSVNNYLANYEWDEEEDEQLAQQEKQAEYETLEDSGYTIDENGKVVLKG